MSDKGIVELARRQGWIVVVHYDCTVQFYIPLWVYSYEHCSGLGREKSLKTIYKSKYFSLDGSLERQIQQETDDLLRRPIAERMTIEDDLRYLQRIAAEQLYRDSWSALCKAIAENNSTGGD